MNTEKEEKGQTYYNVIRKSRHNRIKTLKIIAMR